MPLKPRKKRGFGQFLEFLRIFANGGSSAMGVPEIWRLKLGKKRKEKKKKTLQKFSHPLAGKDMHMKSEDDAAAETTISMPWRLVSAQETA